MEDSYQIEHYSCDLEEVLLLRRLKALGAFWRQEKEDVNTSTSEWKYNDLAVHLASSDFISHASTGVKLLTAYNLAHVLRIRQCKHPYGTDKLYNIVLFLTSQFERGDERINVQKYQEKILEILLLEDVVKIFWDLSKLKQLTVHVFSTLIRTAHPDFSLISTERIMKLVGILIEHIGSVPLEIIQTIFVNCQSRNKVSNIMAHDVTVRFIRTYKDVLGPTIEKVMFKDLLGRVDPYVPEEDNTSTITLEKMKHWLTRLWKLHAVCNDITIPILRNLESSLYTMTHNCRYVLILFLGKLFSDPSNASLHEVCSSLWKGFLGRFQDKNLEIRLVCLDQVPDLFKIVDLRDDLVSTFRKRKMDRVSRLRIKLASLVFILLKDSNHLNLEVASDLSMILEEMAMNPEVKLRLSCLQYMGELYDFFTEKERHDLPMLQIVKKYPKSILEHYWVYEKQWREERLTVIQLMNRYVIPYSLPPEQRMKRLLKVLATLDFDSCSTLAKIKYHQHIACKQLLGVIKFMKRSMEGDKTGKNLADLNAMALGHHIPIPFKSAIQSVDSFAWKLTENDAVAEFITNILTHKSLGEIDQLLESLKGNRKYSNEFTWILELSSDWLFDEQSYKIFVSYLDHLVRGRMDLLEELCPDKIPIENYFKLLEVSSATSLSCFHDDETIWKFINWFQMSKDRSIKLHVLKILTMVQAEDKQLLTKYPQVMNELIIICQELCSQSDTEIAKWSIRSLMISEPKREEISHYFQSVVKDLVVDMTSPDLLRAYCSIYYLGYISLYMGTYFQNIIPDVLSEQVFNKVMLQEESSFDISSMSMSCTSIKNVRIRIKSRYLKFLGQYAFEGEGISCDDVLNLLFEVIENGASFLGLSCDEEAIMRLSAGCSVLNVLRGGRMDMLTCHQFYLLSDLMIDAVPTVRELFCKKLHIALGCDYPKITLPPELLSLFILANFEDSEIEPGEESNIITTLRDLFSMKLNFVKWHMETGAFSDCGSNVNEVLVYGLLALSHSKIFTLYNNLEQLKKVKEKLKVFLYILLANKDVDLGFYKKQVKMVKIHTLKGESEDSNKKLWTLCDIALLQMDNISIGTSDVTQKPTLPMEFFEPKSINNSRNYLSKKTIASLFAKGDQCHHPRSSESDDHEEVSELDEAEMNNLVVMVGEGNMTTEDELDLKDEMSFQIDEDSEFDSEARRSSGKKRKTSDI